jgi:uncharacterized repeat protein (TIGR02543 family)
VQSTPPATEPSWHTFSKWAVNSAALASGQKSVAFTMDGAVTVVAHWTLN